MRIRHADLPVTASGGSYYSASLTTTNTAQAFTYIRNDNSMTAQYGHSAGGTSGFVSSGVAGTVGAIDTNLDSYITFNGDHSDSADLVRLEAYWINYIEG